MAEKRKVRPHVKKNTQKAREVDVKKGTSDLSGKPPTDADAIDSQMAALQSGALVENPKQNDQDKKPEHANVTYSPKYNDVKSNPFYVMNLHQQRQFANQIGVMKWQTLKGTALIAAIKKKVIADKLDLFVEAEKSVNGAIEGFAAKLADGEDRNNPNNAIMSHAAEA